MHRFTIFALFFALSSAQSPKTVDEILSRTSAAYKNLKAYHIEADNLIEIAVRGVVQASGETNLDLSTVKPDKFRLLRKEKNSELLCVNDGETSWMYMPKVKQYTKQTGASLGGDEEESGAPNGEDPVFEAQRSVAGRFEGLSRLAPIATAGKEDILKVGGNKERCWVVQVKNPDPAGTSHQFWIDQTNYMVLKTVQTSSRTQNGVLVSQAVTMNVKKLDLSAPADNVFSFTPPDKAKEVELLNIPGVNHQSLTGTHAADFKLKDMEGREYTLASLRGKVVMLDFWATWCGPCRRELPSIEKLYQKYKDSGVVILGVNDEESSTVKGFVKKNEYSFPTLQDGNRKVHSAYRVRSIPNVVIIGPDGVIAKHFIGGRSEEELRAALDAASKH